MEEAETWLTLKEAAQLLGVHETTLRRWANKGDIPVMFTPGGHRRFARSDVDSLARRGRSSGGSSGGSPEALARRPEISSVGRMWADRALQLTRREITERGDEEWIRPFDESERARGRQMGQRLMGLTMQYVASEDEAEDILEEARSIGHWHGLKARELGISLREALHAALFFRDALVEAAIQLPETARVRPQANRRLLRRINAVLNAVQLAVAEVYDEG